MFLKQCSSLLHFHIKHGYRYLQNSTFIDVKMKWIRDRGLDHAVEKEKHLKSMVLLKNLLKLEPGKCLPVSVVSEKKDELGLSTRAISFIRKYPTVFEEFSVSNSHRPYVRLTQEVLRVDEEELRIFENHQQDLADRLLKLLMMTREKKLPLEIIDQLKWDMGLPDDYVLTLIPNFPDYFEVVGSQSDSKLELELVCWSKELAVSVMERNAMSKGEYKKGMPLAFPLNFSRGFDLEKKVLKWVNDWQKLPYISPYEDATHLHPKSDLAEKWMVGVLHELFHLLIPKKTERNIVLSLGEHLGFRPRFARAFAHHPGIFYISNKIKTCTVLLREAYKRDLLVEKHPLMGMRYQYIHLMNKGREKRDMETSKSDKLKSSSAKMPLNANSEQITQVEDDRENEDESDGSDVSEDEGFYDSESEIESDDGDDSDTQHEILVRRGSKNHGQQSIEKMKPARSSFISTSNGRHIDNKSSKAPATFSRKTEIDSRSFVHVNSSGRPNGSRTHERFAEKYPEMQRGSSFHVKSVGRPYSSRNNERLPKKRNHTDANQIHSTPH